MFNVGEDELQPTGDKQPLFTATIPTATSARFSNGDNCTRVNWLATSQTPLCGIRHFPRLLGTF